MHASFFFFLGINEKASEVAFRAWVAEVIADNTTKDERPELKTVPRGYPAPRADVLGCVHLVDAEQLSQVIQAFICHRWSLECEQHNQYGGSLLEVCGSQSKMKMFTHKVGPFRP